MSHISHDATSWTLSGHIARLAGAMIAELDLERPDLGLHALRVDEATINGRLLVITPNEELPAWPAKLPAWPAQLIDAYIRGNDLVATYAGVESWPYAPQIYWCAESIPADGLALSSRSLTALSIVVSIQTNLLDTHPRIVVHSALPADDVLLISVVGDDMLVDSHVEGIQTLDPRSTACGLVWRLPGDKLSYAEIMPLNDFRQLSVVRTGGTIGSRWELFTEFLEKGVIRRARVQSLFVPRENDVQLVAECCQAIDKRPLPLTT